MIRRRPSGPARTIPRPDVLSKWLGAGQRRLNHALHRPTAAAPCARKPAAAFPYEYPVVDVGVCIGTNCYVKGSWKLLEGLSAELKRRGLTERCRVKARFCTGQCQDGPNIAVNGRIIGISNPEDAAGIVDRHLIPALDGPFKEKEEE